MSEVNLQKFASCTSCTHFLIDNDGDLKCDKGRMYPDVTRVHCPDYRKNDELIRIVNEIYGEME